MSGPLGEVRAEVERLHRFLADWFGGAVAQTDAEFHSGLADHLPEVVGAR